MLLQSLGGQDPPQEMQAGISFSPAPQAAAHGCALGKDTGPAGPSALPGHTEEPAPHGVGLWPPAVG